MLHLRREDLSPRVLWNMVALLGCSISVTLTHAQIVPGEASQMVFPPASLKPATRPLGEAALLAPVAVFRAPAVEPAGSAPLAAALPPPVKALPVSPVAEPVKAVPVPRVQPPVVAPPAVTPEAPLAEPVAPAPILTPSPPPAPPVAPLPTPVPSAPVIRAYSPKGIIRVSGKTFVDDACREFTISGWNQWYDFLKAAIDTLADPAHVIKNTAGLTEDNPIAQRFQTANTAGLNVFRFFGTGGDDSVAPLQSHPGVYNETVFRGIDYILAQAAQHKLKVIIALSDFWTTGGDGQKAYADWASVTQDGFWDSEKARALYTAHMKVMTDRVNTFTGVAYKDDPTIMAWNLMNEPRFPMDYHLLADPSATLTRWYNFMASQMKIFDPKHMVSTGEEGFFALNTPYTQYNPFGKNGQIDPSNTIPDFAGRSGQDGLDQHASPNIDYVDMHFWPDNWDQNTSVVPQFITQWIDGHIKAATALRKPLLMEEFGKIANELDPHNISTVRDPVFRAVYDAVKISLTNGGPLKGALFWEWVADGTLTVRTSIRGVNTQQTTWGLVHENSAFVASLAGRPVPGCLPPAPIPPPTVALPPPPIPAAPAASTKPASRPAALPAVPHLPPTMEAAAGRTQQAAAAGR